MIMQMEGLSPTSLSKGTHVIYRCSAGRVPYSAGGLICRVLYPIGDRHANSYQSSDSKDDLAGIDSYVSLRLHATQQFF
jgi:hypothetical protein